MTGVIVLRRAFPSRDSPCQRCGLRRQVKRDAALAGIGINASNRASCRQGKRRRASLAAAVHKDFVNGPAEVPAPSALAIPHSISPAPHRILSVAPPDTHRRFSFNLRCVSGGATERIARGLGRAGQSKVNGSDGIEREGVLMHKGVVPCHPRIATVALPECYRSTTVQLCWLHLCAAKVGNRIKPKRAQCVSFAQPARDSHPGDTPAPPKRLEIGQIPHGTGCADLPSRARLAMRVTREA
jgi:hypothetical protein